MRLNQLALALALVALAAGPAIPRTLLGQSLLNKLDNKLQATGPAAGAAPAAPAPVANPGYLGMEVDETAEQGKGVLITRVKKGAPSEFGGLKVGDIIVEIDGTPCLELNDLDTVLAKATVGTRLTMKV